MISFPNAKINLGLHVTTKRPDGFHDIETVFFPVELCDVLEIVPDPGGEGGFTITGLEIPGQSNNNLCLRALQLFHSPPPYVPTSPPPHLPTSPPPYVPTSLPPHLPTSLRHKFHLHKLIPPGAGLGGGSSDAAFTLKMLNEMHGFPFSTDELTAMAARLGSDCPFFLKNKPVYATGRGDRFEDLPLDLSSYRIELFFPQVHVSTAESYRMITPAPSPRDLREVLLRPPGEWKGLLVNDFEKPVFEKYPEIKRLKESVYEKGAIYASMTGSGSAVFGIFDRETE